MKKRWPPLIPLGHELTRAITQAHQAPKTYVPFNKRPKRSPVPAWKGSSKRWLSKAKITLPKLACLDKSDSTDEM